MPTSISNIQLSVKQLPSKMSSFTVLYDVSFTQFEVNNFTFVEGFEIWEADSGPLSDDQLTKLVGKVEFKPSKTQEFQRQLVAEVSNDILDTEIFGKEEIYVKVKLQNLDIPQLEYQKDSPIIPLAL